MEATGEQFLDFMSGVPVAEPEEGSLAWAQRYVSAYLEAFKDNDGLFTQAEAARVLRVTRGAVQDLIRRGKLQTLELEHGVFVTGKSLAPRLAGMKGKPGRPRLVDALDLGKEPFK
jgi:predicted XRE-type DNA-binding protein